MRAMTRNLPPGTCPASSDPPMAATRSARSDRPVPRLRAASGAPSLTMTRTLAVDSSRRLTSVQVGRECLRRLVTHSRSTRDPSESTFSSTGPVGGTSLLQRTPSLLKISWAEVSSSSKPRTVSPSVRPRSCACPSDTILATSSSWSPHFAGSRSRSRMAVWMRSETATRLRPRMSCRSREMRWRSSSTRSIATVSRARAA